MRRTLGIFARWPSPGAGKSRLAVALGPEATARLAAAMLRDIVSRPACRGETIVVAHAPGDEATAARFRDWLPRHIDLWPQPEGTLGDRLACFFHDHVVDDGDEAVVIGADSPSLPGKFLRTAWEALETAACVIGPAVDGGYYLLGLRQQSFAAQSIKIESLFSGIAWDGPAVLRQTVERIARAGLSLRVLPPWYDVDTATDLAALEGHLLALQAAQQASPCPQTESVIATLSQSTEGIAMSGSLSPATTPRYRVVDFSEIPGVPCPCGTARRAFADLAEYPATIHVTDIADDARVHYHKSHTETYYILECQPDAALQLDDEIVPVRAGTCILIPPGVRHRAIGQMRIINIVIPKFDPEDEHFD